MKFDQLLVSGFGIEYYLFSNKCSNRISLTIIFFSLSLSLCKPHCRLFRFIFHYKSLYLEPGPDNNATADIYFFKQKKSFTISRQIKTFSMHNRKFTMLKRREQTQKKKRVQNHLIQSASARYACGHGTFFLSPVHSVDEYYEFIRFFVLSENGKICF